MLNLHKLRGPEKEVREPYRADWESYGIDFFEDVVYGQGGGHDLYLDLMVPQKRRESLSPALVWVHGGGWSSADLTKKYRPVQALVALCKAGFVCASIDYRLVTEKAFPAPVEDCKCAVRFLKAHSEQLGIDPVRIGMWGESAGGQLAALVGASYMNPELEGNGGWGDQSSKVRAVCDWYCGGDMTHMGAGVVSTVRERAEKLGIRLSGMEDRHLDQDNPNNLGNMIFGKPAREAPELAMAISPIFYVDQKQPAYLLMHGDSDQVVPLEFSYNYYDALLSHGHDATFVIIPRQGHGFFSGEGYYDIVHNFFVKHLGKGETL